MGNFMDVRNFRRAEGVGKITLHTSWNLRRVVLGTYIFFYFRALLGLLNKKFKSNKARYRNQAVKELQNKYNPKVSDMSSYFVTSALLFNVCDSFIFQLLRFLKSPEDERTVFLFLIYIWVPPRVTRCVKCVSKYWPVKNTC